VTVLEIAEAFAKLPAKPKRSMLFVWHTGEEAGLWGASYFTRIQPCRATPSSGS
jgi:Zn-dependent M28 family amino/carboxypeptidase